MKPLLPLQLLSLSTIVSPALAFIPIARQGPTTTQTQTQTQIQIRVLVQQTHLHAKRRKNDKVEDNSWYDEVGKAATPDEVFWSEMERQKTISGLPIAPTAVDNPFANINIGSAAAIDASPSSSSSSMDKMPATGGKGQGGGSANSSGSASGIMGTPLGEDKATTNTLANFAAFMVDDNWLDEEYAEMMGLEDVDIDQQDVDIDKHYAEMDIDDGTDDDAERIDVSSLTIGGTNPWDLWNGDKELDDDDDLDKERIKIILEKCKFKSSMPYFVLVFVARCSIIYYFPFPSL